MAFDQEIDRTNDALALIREEVVPQIFEHLPESSVIMRLGKRLRDMRTHEETLRVKDGLPVAFFTSGGGTAVSGDTKRIQTTDVTWTTETLRAAKIGCIVPIGKDIFKDVRDADDGYNIWDEIRPDIIEALAIKFDAAVLHGTDAPSDWPDDLMTQIAAESQTVGFSAQDALGDDLYSMLLGSLSTDAAGVVGLVEEKGFQVTGHLAALVLRRRLRGARDSTGQPLFASLPDPTSPFRYTIDGEPTLFPKHGALDQSAVLDIAGDWKQLVYSMRKDIDFEILREASIYDNSSPPQLQFALAQQDMIALKVTMRIGWQLPKPDNRLDTSTPLAFAALVP